MSIAKGATDIGKAYLGGNSVSKMYLGNDLVFGGTGSVSYLECTGSQYVNTGITFNGVESFEIELDFAPTRFWNWNHLLCIGTSSTNESWIYSDGRFAFRYNNVRSSFIQLTIDTRVLLRAVYQNPTCTIYFDGVEKASFSASPTSVTSPLWFFYRTYFAEVKVWGFSVVQNGMSVMNCTPYKNGGVGCFYDYVSGNYIYSDGADNFVIGE